ncbi:4-hydroxy-3-methylbut-2-enyl diphosphate reductase [Balneolales bacterium ANBcel1]|nr:4-hydroxy-3-methylbut-2-enyl diphosphate reductase [Balneolales bacterium ANBcel1]
MPREFHIPDLYQSQIIKTVKNARQILDPRKKDRTPSVLDLGPVRYLIPRHFGFCYGVENAIDIAYRTVENHPGKNIFLLSEMIHNPTVNKDLEARGVRFLFETDGSERIPIATLTPDDIVIVPAFGTTVEIQKKLEAQGVDPYQYDTTCPFVIKVWNRGKQLGKKGHALVIHGKHKHEETRATFSHSSQQAACVVVLNPEEARILADIMVEKRPRDDFQKYFGMKCTDGFDPLTDLKRFGVINQTTMLASETREVMEILKQAVIEKHGEADVEMHFADTSDTLCYATNENQSATYALMEERADLALVVGGYNSSNTMHLVELLEERFPTYHIRDASEIKSQWEIHHFNQWKKKVEKTRSWMPKTDGPMTIALTSGASCPDALVDEVLLKTASWFEDCLPLEKALEPFTAEPG